MNYAVVNADNIVVNIILWDGASAYDAGAGHNLVASDAANIGDSYVGGAFIPPGGA